MAYENFRGRRGYISEKIFDALQAGSVPVYLGEERIAEFVPEKLSSMRETSAHAANC